MNKVPGSGSQHGYWVFVVCASAFVLWLVLINPLLNWEFDRPGEVSRVQYGLLTGGAIITAIIMVFIINWRIEKKSKPFSKLLDDIGKSAIRDEIDHHQYMKLIRSLPPFGKEPVELVRFKYEQMKRENNK